MGLNGWQLEVGVGVLLLFYGVFAWRNLLPSIDSIVKLCAVLNSRGGNIMVLASFSIVFFTAALRFAYFTIQLSVDGKIDIMQSLANQTFAFMTGTAFGGSFTSMVKAMTGEDTSKPAVQLPAAPNPSADGGKPNA